MTITNKCFLILNVQGSQVSNTVWYCDSDNVADNGVEKQATTQSNDQHQEHDHPSFSVPTSTRVSRRNKRKESKHYQVRVVSAILPCSVYNIAALCLLLLGIGHFGITFRLLQKYAGG